MVSRATLSTVHNQMQMSTSRATAREFDDDHLMQQVKKADVYHSETPSDFERWQTVGLTAVPMKQTQEQQQQQTSQNNNKKDGDWNHNQPRGDAAEIMMTYISGSRSHPIAGAVDDRRVRPYGMKEGEGALYDPTGSGQLAYFKDDGFYLIATNAPSLKSPNGKERIASLRHVTKQQQSRNVEQGKNFNHLGTVDTEVRCTSTRIEFLDGNDVVGYYDKTNKKWWFGGTTLEREGTSQIRDTAPRIDHN